ncbi:DNA polymerase eta [Folsomia candida]|uniref:DNA polymerase eta n=1 Tax=Folsomia candida TaxID=158441 RepID=A0A226DCM5_FOLCA|nr:DNA polymerase eta [Folsomia candida]
MSNNKENVNVTLTLTSKNSWKRIPLPELDDQEHFTGYVTETLAPNSVIGMLDMDAFEGISRDDVIGTGLKKCPEIRVIRKDVRFSKPENWNLRHSSWTVLDTILKYRKETGKHFIVEYASNDEYYFDLTLEIDRLVDTVTVENIEKFLTERVLRMKKTFVELRNETLDDWSSILKILQKEIFLSNIIDKPLTLLRLILGCTILHEIKEFIFTETNFEASGGISCNKLLTKLACPLHKPGGITILPGEGFIKISGNIPIEKLPSLGGDRGKKLSDAVGEVMLTIRDLATLPLSKIMEGTDFPLGEVIMLRKLARGRSDDAVVEKLMKLSATVGRANLKGYIFLPRKEEDRGKAPLSQRFAYTIDTEKVSEWTKKNEKELVDKILTEFFASVKGQGEGIIVKISYSVRAFRKLV